MKYTILIFLLVALAFQASGQDTTQVKKTNWSGQWRTAYHTSINKDNLKDFQSLATGGYLKFTYQPVKKLQLGAALYGSLNLGLQDLTITDAATGKISRYESGFFDVQNPGDRFIGYPGELFVTYTAKKHQLTVGRMKFKSPFINPQDGRMIPTLIEGARYAYKSKKLKGGLGFINRIAPRSTAGFFNIGEAIGQYPVGRNSEGAPSLYAGNTTSDFILTANMNFSIGQSVQVNVWNYYMDNISNTLHTKVTYPISEQTRLAIEWLHQNQLGDGGNAIDSLRYFNSTSSDVFGIQLKQKMGGSNITLSYNRILDGGQFLFPREFGRESLFSFQKRERSEGTADSHALVLYYEKPFRAGVNSFNTILSVGHHWRPDVSNAEANKYALPDYAHINFDVFWSRSSWKHLKPELLITYKMGTGTYPENPNVIFNKVDLLLVNVIVNYNF